MAKNKGDIILRDRLQFTLDGSGNLDTVYGRMDLSQYTVGNKGLAIKQVRFQLRDPTGASKCGIFSIIGDNAASGASAQTCEYKLYATTRAYENATDVGIASPDVLCVEEGQWIVGPDASPTYAQWDRKWYGPDDLHPSGYTVVSDLLIGIAFDTWILRADDTCELDVLIVAEEVSVSTERMNEMMAQARDL